jgi:predicted dehydrogenase
LRKKSVQFSVVILGLGRIGIGYDRKLPSASHVLTHARAFHLQPGFKLVGAFDPCPSKRSRFERDYREPAYASIPKLLREKKPDVVVIASPTGTHRKLAETTLRLGTCRAILCEKPLTMNRADSEAVVRACRAKKIPLYVNFIRRADPGVLEVKRRIETGRLRGPFKAVVWYGKGLLHSGSHFLDLLSFWLGPVRGGTLIARGQRRIGNYREPDCRFAFKKGSAVFLAAGNGHVSQGTVEIIWRNGRLSMEKSGAVRWQPRARPGDHRPQPRIETLPGDMQRYQMHVAEQLHAALAGQKNILCTGGEALRCQKWIHRVLRYGC